MKVYIIDNYDSFTYNLYQTIGEILSGAQSRGSIGGFQVIVKRNDQVGLDEIRGERPDRLIISPGPGSPDDAAYFGICADVIRELGPTIPLLGICLGMQGIVHVFGGKIVKARLPMHGKISPIRHDGRGLFAGIPDGLEIMRYHSLIAEPESLPGQLDITAVTGELPPDAFAEHARTHQGGDIAITGEIMGIRHRRYPISGVQFHPESFASEGGKELMRNFLFSC